MKRLTGRAPDGTAYLYNMGGTNAAIDRLAAYEDTGLEPELIIPLLQNGQSAIDTNKQLADRLSRFRWIPVTERLPEKGEPVVGWSAPLADLTITCAEDFYSDGITHWMPLPEPPKEDDDNG